MAQLVMVLADLSVSPGIHMEKRNNPYNLYSVPTDSGTMLCTHAHTH